MSWLGVAFTFAVSWWLLLFMVLPWGGRPDDDPVPGSVASAPAKPRLLLKFLITTVLAVALTGAAAWLADSGLIQLRPPPGG
jgi:predicted secreted protein